MSQPISITAIASISPLGTSRKGIWNSYLEEGHALRQKTFGGLPEWVGDLSADGVKEIAELRSMDVKYRNLDDSVLYAMSASRKAVEDAGWGGNANFGINIGSSRGATSLFEKYHEEYLHTKRTSTLSSPTTTLGNISSWVAHDLGSTGPEISHSITCSTALHALLNGMAWINSGMSDKFLVGGSEAPLTAFTIAQMKALKIYANSKRFPSGPERTNKGLRNTDKYPCRSMDLGKRKNAMVLGEGAAVACLEIGLSEKSLALIEGVGYATELLEHNVSISTNAVCFQRSMRMALGKLAAEEIDVIVMHAPGTVKGDRSELNAIHHLFGKYPPALTGNKWKFGHTFGASGMLSVELAILMMKHQHFVEIPFLNRQDPPKHIKKILVNAVGFGGNAVSVLLSAP